MPPSLLQQYQAAWPPSRVFAFSTWPPTKVCQVLDPESSGGSNPGVGADWGDYIDTPAAVSGDVRGRYVDEASPLDSITLVKDWWSACETHTTCSRTLSGCRAVDSNQTPLPNRCIRVTSLDNAADLEFTLEETEGKHGRYICLSHRWVQPDTGLSSTTTSNYAARTSGTDFGHLPHNFLQAFRTAAEFGIQYIWIDTLCIIQDVASDWEEESTRMGEYYQTAAFTLVSTFSTDDPDAEYSPPKPLSLVRLPYRDDAGMRRGYFYVYPRRSPSTLKKLFTEHIRASQILTRGWVFQEWLLSRRIVCFTQSGVYTQCVCQQDTVRNQLGEDIGWGSHQRQEAAAVLSIKSSLHLELHTPENIYGGWEAVVEQYSSLDFSYPDKDRIRALFGVAREFAATLSQMPCHKALETVDGGFITGLWKNDLHRGLLWQQVNPGTHERLANLPTWSWVSINSAVRWRSRHWRVIEKDFPLVREKWSRCRSKSELIFVACTTIPSHRIHHQYSPLVQPGSDGELSEVSQQGNHGILRFGGGGQDVKPDSNFDMLHLRGRLQPVHIGDHLSNKVPTSAAGLVGCWRYPEFSGLRIVATAGLRDVISGWASLEHPEFQEDSVFTSSPLIFALLVSTLPEISRSSERAQKAGIAKGPGEFNVLYLRRSQEVLDGFERVGMGKLFGYKAKEGFQLAKERDIKLL